MAVEETGHPSVVIELQIDLARITEHHHKGHQFTSGATHLQVSKMSPIHLCLFTGQGLQAQIGLGGFARTDLGYPLPEMTGATRIASFRRSDTIWISRAALSDGYCCSV